MLETINRELRVALDRTQSAAAFEILSSTPKISTNFRLANISRSGMFIETTETIPYLTGNSLHFALHLGRGDDEVSGVGLVRWVRKRELGPYMPRGFGIQVVEFHDHAEKHYLEFLETSLLGLRLTDLMDPNFPMVTPETAVSEVLALMMQRKMDCVIVSDGEGAPLGTFTTHDLPRIVAHPGALKEAVGRHMTPGPHTLSVDDDTQEAYHIMRHGTLMHIPVVDDGLTIGILATRDLVRYWAEYMDLQTKRLARNYDRAMGVIAHDLRTPIGLIQTTNAMLTSGEISPDDYLTSGFPEILDSSCDMMMNLIDDILDIQRIKNGTIRLNPQLIDLQATLQKVLKAFTPAAHAKKIKLTLNIPHALPKIKADPLRLEQVLNNLLSNALKFSHDGGVVLVGAKPLHSQVAFWVSDQGAGIADQELQELFKEYPAISTKPTKGEKSTGLGLAIVKRLVEAHNGTITVESKVGKGTTFHVVLPIDAVQ